MKKNLIKVLKIFIHALMKTMKRKTWKLTFQFRKQESGKKRKCQEKFPRMNHILSLQLSKVCILIVWILLQTALKNALQMILEIILILFTTVILYIFKKVHDNNQYFKKAGIKYSKPLPLVGNMYENIVGRKSLMELQEELYFKFRDEDIYGFFQFTIPAYVIRKPELAEKVLIKDFSHFCDRGNPIGSLDEPQNASLFALTGNTWRATRYKFTPIFTTGKLKFMFNSIADCGKNLMDVLEANNGKEVEMNEIMSHFAMDVIGSCAFGMDNNVLQNPESQFRMMGKKLFFMTLLGNIKALIMLTAPKVGKALGIKGVFDEKVVNYYCQILRDTLNQRQKSGQTRNDFVQMLLQLKEKGKIELKVHDKSDDYLMLDDIDKHGETFELKLTDSILLGGAFSFLSAGFHATAMTLTFTLYELAKRPDIVKKLRDEIRENIENDISSYDEVKNLSYLENVIKEAMRLYPTASSLGRICTKDYTLPNGYTIKKGRAVLIQISGIHKDPAYYPDPLTFNPDRFETPPLPGTYYPFGDGPRVCIAMRFAMLEMKFALAKFINNFDFTLSENMKTPIEIEPRAFLTTPKHPVKLRIKKLSP